MSRIAAAACAATLSLLLGCAAPQSGPKEGAWGVDQGSDAGGVFEAARGGDLGGLRAALARSGDPNAEGVVCPTPQRGTALMAAASAGHADAVRVLLAAGADPNRRVKKVMQWPCNNYSALVFAAKAGHAEAVKVLLAGGADPSLRGGRGSGRTAEEWAQKEGHQAVVSSIAEAKGMSPEERKAVLALAPIAATPAPAEETAAPASGETPAPRPTLERALTPAEREALDKQL